MTLLQRFQERRDLECQGPAELKKKRHNMNVLQIRRRLPQALGWQLVSRRLGLVCGSPDWRSNLPNGHLPGDFPEHASRSLTVETLIHPGHAAGGPVARPVRSDRRENLPAALDHRSAAGSTALDHRFDHRPFRLRQIDPGPALLAGRVPLAARLERAARPSSMAFPPGMSIKDICALLSSVGFSSPPAWLRPYRVLSTGQQFRVTLARLLAEALAGPGPRAPPSGPSSSTSSPVSSIGRWPASASALPWPAPRPAPTALRGRDVS